MSRKLTELPPTTDVNAQTGLALPSRRRALVQTAAAGVAGLLALSTPSILRAQTETGPRRNNTSSFRMQQWNDYFDTLGKGAILADFGSRALHYWGADGVTYRLYPTSVPLTEELTRRGLTEVVRKKVGPSWTPTADMRKRDPSLPPFLEPGPENPLGTHAMYLSWPAYLIHGTHDTRKIGRPSSSGCVGLYNEHISELFAMVPVGTQVRLI